MDDNWFDSGSDGIDLSGDTGAGIQQYADANPGMFDYTTGGDPGFDWGDNGLKLTDAQWQQVGSYLDANPDALDTGTLSSLWNGLGSGLSGAGNFLKGVPNGAWGTAALLGSGLLASKDAEKLLGKQTEAQKELLKYKYDLEKPTAWVAPTGGLLRLK